MARLTDRLTKLEGLQGARRYSPPVAVLSGRLPAEGQEQEWMMQMLWQRGWHDWPGDCVLGLSVTVVDGEPAVLLPPTAYCELSPEQSSLLHKAEHTFPRIEVRHFCGSWGWDRNNDRAEYEAARREAEPFLAELKRAAGARNSNVRAS